MTLQKNPYIPVLLTIGCVAAIIALRRKSSQDDTPVTLITNNNEDMKNYFADREFTQSATATKLGIDNTPDATAWAKLHALRDNVLNPARARLGRAITVNSAYRSPALNKAVGGAANSQHVTGEAADITTKTLTNNRVLFSILAQMGNFDQLIWEKGGQWIHVSYRAGANRKQMLSYNGSNYTQINNNWQNVINA